MNDDDKITIIKLISTTKNQIVQSVITELKKLRGDEYLLLGEDTNLKNVWEEICAQVQSEYSYVWDAYEETIRNFIESVISELPQVSQHILRLDVENDEVNNHYQDDIYLDIIGHAADFESERVRRYIEGDYEEEE